MNRAAGRWFRVVLTGLGAMWLGWGVSTARAADGEATVLPGDVVRAALQHSPALEAADAARRAAEAGVDVAVAAGRPVVDVQARAARYEGLEDVALGPSLTIPEIPDRFSASVGVAQPLYTAGRITGARRGAEAGADAARWDREARESDTVLDALRGYWNWVKAVEAVSSLQAAVDRTEAHARDMDNLYGAGLATDSEKLATDVLLEQTRLRLGSARRRIDVARARIAYLTGRELAADACPRRPPQEAREPAPAAASVVGAAMSNRVERAAARARTEAARRQVEVARGEGGPQVALVGRYEEANPNTMIFPPEDAWNHDAFVGVTLSWPLFDSGHTRAKSAQAAAHAAAARAWREQVDDRLALESREACAALQDAQERVPVALRVRESASRNLRAATDLWNNGLTRHADVLDAMAQLTEAEYQVVEARVDVVLARAGVDYATGRLAAEESQP